MGRERAESVPSWSSFNARCQVAFLFLCCVFGGLCGHQIKPGRSPVFHGVTCWAGSQTSARWEFMTRRRYDGQRDPSLGAREGRREVAQAGRIQTPIRQGGTRAIILGALPQSLAPAIFQDRETWLHVLPVPPPGSRQGLLADCCDAGSPPPSPVLPQPHAPGYGGNPGPTVGPSCCDPGMLQPLSPGGAVQAQGGGVSGRSPWLISCLSPLGTLRCRQPPHPIVPTGPDLPCCCPWAFAPRCS